MIKHLYKYINPMLPDWFSSVALACMMILMTESVTAQGWVANPAVVEKLSKARPQFNYYEEKVPEYTLPDVLANSQGGTFSKAREWKRSGREEVLELFRENVYGRIPSTPYLQTSKIVNEDRGAMGGAATLKEVDIIIDSDGRSLSIRLTMFVPNNVGKPAPLFLLIDNRGPVNTDPTRKTRSEFWPAEDVIERGYGIAVFYNRDVDPDNFDNFQDGIHGVLDRGIRQDDSWGTLAAWAWGASRCMDYFETDKDVDDRKVAVLGHSRGGKTALWAGATDQRFSIVISNESGCGGAALARRRLGETVERINSSFPHWFCLNYRRFNNNEDAMPVDMHMLLALMAPRALYVACADEDLWGDPKGSYLALYHSLPVFRLLKTKSDLPPEMPPLDQPVTSGKVGFHIRTGGHNLILKDWNWFMDFAGQIWE
ncbi:MAG TPA: acetylxylan esterase [Bacteroidales bacterium]|nr:acetylxylan esterase [Bacteroidales bacterium]HPF04158.1 acetylxylan esterase [Bacteroidales bacterium]HPJ59645.1 acetylxylan esterase [Bacteroidales bacterium]HPR10958.1 acetylxylan esterase [Bacteroidales bacterium]HRW85829.1 acetylxylan esterase [Bacteroidales bacterium]